MARVTMANSNQEKLSRFKALLLLPRDSRRLSPRKDRSSRRKPGRA